MKWRTFTQIILLGIFFLLVFYIIYPKYHFFNPYFRGNKITGEVEKYTRGSGWNILEKSKLETMTFRKTFKLPIESLKGEYQEQEAEDEQAASD